MVKKIIHKTAKQREMSLDVLRGVAVFLMILAHTVAFVYIRNDGLLKVAQNLGDTICFTTFLFVSGSATYLAYLKTTKEEWLVKRKRLMERTFKLLLGYYLVAFISSLNELLTIPNLTWLKNVFQILVFAKVPGYTEFLLPFIFYGALVIIFKNTFRNLIKDSKIVITVAFLTYLLGYFTHKISPPSPFIYYKALLAGEGSWYRFPLMQYFGVFIIGMWFAQLLLKKAAYKKKQQFIVRSALVALAVLIFTTLLEHFVQIPYSNLFQRWPPSISFLALGLSFAFIVLFAVRIKLKSISLGLAQTIFVFLGKYAFSIFISHIVILQLEEKIFGYKTASNWKVLFSFVVVIVACIVILPLRRILIHRISAKSKEPRQIRLETLQTRRQKSRSILKEKYFTTTCLILLFSLGGLVFGIKSLLSNTTEVQLPTPNDVSQEDSSKVHGAFIDKNAPTAIYGHGNRHWILKDVSTHPQYASFTYTVEVAGPSDPDSFPRYKISGSSQEGLMEKVSERTYQAKILPDTLTIGAYDVQATVSLNNTLYTTNKFTFYVSYPLYVAWTLDWEGYDVPDNELQNLTNFSQKHNDLPMTHLFNPRIYATSEMSQERVNSLTSWIIQRQASGDEIGLHLHMYYDLVQASGVQPRKEPKWTDYLDNGLDVPCSAYTYDEFTKILNWAKAEFSKHGLGIPKSFRAGGWFADLSILKALEYTGFLIDTSGREAYVWGTANNKIPGFWKLNSTTKPYQPSKSNQNSSSPAPTLAIWEFPNNGADSWFYTAEDLQKRFEDNYKNTFLLESQTLTYLSHPHEIHKDIQILEPVFTSIDQHLAERDQGPIIYVTLEDAYTNTTGQF